MKTDQSLREGLLFQEDLEVLGVRWALEALWFLIRKRIRRVRRSVNRYHFSLLVD